MKLILAMLAALPIIASVRAEEELKLTDIEKAVIEATNAERKNAELPPLKPNRKLVLAAREHATNMAKQDKLEHILDEKSPADRVLVQNYKFMRVGENIAWNQKTSTAVLEGWMNSEGHKANILHADYTEIGVAMAENAKGERYWVQVFGKQQ